VVGKEESLAIRGACEQHLVCVGREEGYFETGLLKGGCWDQPTVLCSICSSWHSARCFIPLFVL
jgi:hypothetical protein